MIVFQLLDGYIFSMIYCGDEKNNTFFFTADMIKDREFARRLQEKSIYNTDIEKQIVKRTINQISSIFLNPHFVEYFIDDNDYRIIYDEFYKKYYLQRKRKK